MLLAAFHNILWRCLSGQEFLYLLSKPLLEYCILLCLAELYKRLQPDGRKVLIKMMWQLTCGGKKFLKDKERGRKREEGGRGREGRTKERRKGNRADCYSTHTPTL